MRRAILFFSAVKQPLPFRFVASDMDGTVLSGDNVLSEYTKETICALTQRLHVPFIFATGRIHADVQVVNRNLQQYIEQHVQKVSHTPTYLITSNGAVVHEARTDERCIERTIPADIVRELYAFVPSTETRVNTNVYQSDRWYCRMNWEEFLQFHKESGFRFSVLEQIPASASAGGLALHQGCADHVSKISFTSWDKPLLERVERALLERYKDRLNITFSAHYCVDVMAPGVSKASALRSVFAMMPLQPLEVDDPELAGLKNFPKDLSDAALQAVVDNRMRHSMAFGDDLNDAAMLQGVGKGCVMRNCNPRLREACPELEVIKSNVENGPACKLREVFALS